MAFSKAELARASKLAMEEFKMPDGTTIQAMKNANRSYYEFESLKKKKQRSLPKPIRKKGK